MQVVWHLNAFHTPESHPSSSCKLVAGLASSHYSHVKRADTSVMAELSATREEVIVSYKERLEDLVLGNHRRGGFI